MEKGRRADRAEAVEMLMQERAVCPRLTGLNTDKLHEHR